MKIRKVELDFSAAKIHWTPDSPEFAQFWNASSTLLPYLEPFLNRTVREAAKALPATEAQLIEDARIFIAQEGSHYRNHAKLNQILRDSGYPGLVGRERGVKADYDRYEKEKGLKYCLGYAEGFETLGPIFAGFFLEAARELKKTDVDSSTATLWRWHFAEEYEHRHVCHELYQRLYGGYWFRIYGIAYAGRHMLDYILRTMSYLLGEDHKAGRVDRSLRSHLRRTGMLLRLLAYVTPRALSALSPRYDPKNIPEPAGAAAILAQAETQWTAVPSQAGPPS
jgi:predicted metal-dependent hydrolase